MANKHLGLGLLAIFVYATAAHAEVGCQSAFTNCLVTSGNLSICTATQAACLAQSAQTQQEISTVVAGAASGQLNTSQEASAVQVLENVANNQNLDYATRVEAQAAAKQIDTKLVSDIAAGKNTGTGTGTSSTTGTQTYSGTTTGGTSTGTSSTNGLSASTIALLLQNPQILAYLQQAQAQQSSQYSQQAQQAAQIQALVTALQSQQSTLSPQLASLLQILQAQQLQAPQAQAYSTFIQQLQQQYQQQQLLNQFATLFK